MSLVGKPVDIREMVGSRRVVIFAESSHNPRVYKTEVLDALDHLATMGFTVLGLEMLTTDLNRHQGASRRGAFSAHLSQYWKWQAPTGGTVAGDYVALVARAKARGMRVTGLDMPYDEADRLACSKPLHECSDTAHFARNRHMAGHVEAMARAGEKIVLVMHYWHAVAGASFGAGRVEKGVKQLLVERGLSPVVVKLVGGAPLVPGRASRLTIPTAARATGMEHKRFYVTGAGHRSEDFTIHLPQVSPGTAPPP